MDASDVVVPTTVPMEIGDAEDEEEGCWAHLPVTRLDIDVMRDAMTLESSC